MTPQGTVSGRPLPTDADLDRMQWVADPYADDTIAQVLAGIARPADRVLRLGQLNDIVQSWKTNADVAGWTAAPGTPPYIAGPLAAYVQAARLAPPPAWIDPASAHRAGCQFVEHGALSITLLHCASLPESYVVPDMATVLQSTGKLIDRVDLRIRATGAMIVPAMMVGGLTTMEGAGIAQVLKVRLIHAAIRNLILGDTPSAVAPASSITRIKLDASLFPAKLRHFVALYNVDWDLERCGLPNNQEELACTLLTFSYVFLRSMRRLGIPFSPQEEADYLHIWNVIGHYLGIDESLLVEDMDGAERLFFLLQRRGREHLKKHPGKDVRPALGAALMDAMEKAIPAGVFRPFPVLMTLFLMETDSARDLGLDQRPIPARSRRLFDRILAWARALDARVRRFYPDFSMCRLVTRAIGYRLTCVLMMSLVRDLLLPDALRPEAEKLIARWGRDPKASGWMNVLEDGFTTWGTWTKRDPPKR